MQEETQKKQLSVSKNLKDKLTFFVSQIQTEKSRWINENSFTLEDSQEVRAKLSQVFDMSFHTFIKFIQLMGCKVKQLRAKDGSNVKVFKVTITKQQDQESTNKVLNDILKLQQQQNGQNFDQLSIEVNLQKPELELLNLQQQSQLKQNLLKNFKNNIKSTNEFVDHIIYRILVQRTKKQMSICQVLELLTELRDRMFENQRQIQQCIQSFQDKISNYRQDKEAHDTFIQSMSAKSQTGKQEDLSLNSHQQIQTMHSE